MEGLPDAGGDVSTRVRQLLAPRPDPVGTRDREGDDRRARAEGEDRDAVLRLLESTVRAARPLREDEQDVTFIEDPPGESERLDVCRSPIDGMDATVGSCPADDRPIEQLLLAKPLDTPPE